MRVKGHKLTDIFLTAANTVGMRWELIIKGKSLNVLFIYKDKRGTLKIETGKTTDFDEFIKFYNEKAKDYLNVKYL